MTVIINNRPVSIEPEDRGPLAFAMRESGEKCAHGHAGLYEVAGTDEASREYLGTWRFWCPTCQALTLTMPEALAALDGLSRSAAEDQRPVGVIVQVSLPLALELGDA